MPGLALGILHRGRLVKATGYGFANVEHRVPVDTATIFQSASVAKQFTAAAILLLQQDGMLTIDDAISRHLERTPDAWRGITVRHLLTSTSGIPDYEQDAALDLRKDYTEEELLRHFAGRDLLFAPGDDWAYSNSGYVLLGLIIRRVTGAHWSEFLQKRIFDPLQMRTARTISEADIVPNRASGYRVAGGVLKNQEWVAPSLNTTADGSLYFTVMDLAKWDAALDSDALMSDTLKRMMWSPARLNDGTPASYGLGVFLLDEPGRKGVESDGAWQGFRSYVGRFHSESVTVILLANSSSLDAITAGHTIAGLFRPSLAPPKRARRQLPATELDRYTGQYRLATGEVLHITRTPDGLRVAGDVPLGNVVPGAPDVFFGERWAEARLTFVRGANGDVQWLRLQRHPSWPARARRVR